MLTRRGFIIASGAALLTASQSRAAQGVTTIGGDAFGSYWRLTVPHELVRAATAADLDAIIASVDADFSPYRSDSLLTRFNASGQTGWLDISGDMHRVLSTGLDLAAASNGAFDPTVGPSVARYGFGPITGGSGNYSQIELVPGGMRKQRADLSIDLCGVAKGYALDLMGARLIDAGINAFLLDLGGELLARGAHPAGRPWQVAVDAPGGGLTQTFALDNRAVATSGTTVQGYRVNGRTMGHIIDPATGTPSSTRAVSVSVLADTAMQADGWATALMAMPHSAALTLAKAQGLDTLFLIESEAAYTPVMTGNFAGLVVG